MCVYAGTVMQLSLKGVKYRVKLKKRIKRSLKCSSSNQQNAAQTNGVVIYERCITWDAL